MVCYQMLSSTSTLTPDQQPYSTLYPTIWRWHLIVWVALAWLS